MTQVKRIKTTQDYEQAIARLRELIDLDFASKLEDRDEIEMLVHEVGEYKQKVFQIKPRHTIEELIEDELDARLVDDRRDQAEIEIELDDL